jgi:hypothetical protein
MQLKLTGLSQLDTTLASVAFNLTDCRRSVSHTKTINYLGFCPASSLYWGLPSGDFSVSSLQRRIIGVFDIRTIERSEETS